MGASFCKSCKFADNSPCFPCSIKQRSNSKPQQVPAKIGSCAACCASKDASGDSCPGCGIWFCIKHTTRIGTVSQPFGCPQCMGRDQFFAQLSEKVEPFCQRAEEALADIFGDSSSRRQKSLILEHLVQAFDHLSRLGAHWLLEQQSPLLLRVVNHLLEHELASLLETSQAVRWHLPEYLPDELVGCVEKLNISGQDSCRPSAAKSKQRTRSRKPAVAVFWHDILRNQDALKAVVLQLASRMDIEFYILAAQLLDDGAFAADLQRDIPKKCWKFLLGTNKMTVKPPTNITTRDIESVRNKIRKMGITVLLTWNNSTELGACARPGFEVQHAFRFGHKNQLQGFSNGVILDPQCLSELKLDPAEAENIWCISCVTAPWDFKGKLQRGERKPCGSEFRLLALVDPDQPNISPLILEDILLLLNEFPNIRACFCGLDLMQTVSIMREMEAFALKRDLDRHFFIRQTKWWGCRPTKAFAQRIRDQIDVCLTTGPGIEAVNVALGTGTPVVAQRAWPVGGKMAGCCAFSMLHMCGLGALAVPAGVRPGLLVKQLYRDRGTLRFLQRILDDQNGADGPSPAFFDLKRTAQDLAAVACALHVSDNIPSQNERNCISRPPEQPYFFLGDDGLLHLTASGRVRQADLELGKRPDIPEFRCVFGPDAEIDVDLEHENMETCISSPSRAQAEDATMKDNVDLEPERMDLIDLTHDDSDVHEDGGGVPGEAPSAGDLLGRGAVLHPGSVLTVTPGRPFLTPGRRWRGRRRGGPGRRPGWSWPCARGGPVR
jgi:hypothetical protein